MALRNDIGGLDFTILPPITATPLAVPKGQQANKPPALDVERGQKAEKKFPRSSMMDILEQTRMQLAKMELGNVASRAKSWSGSQEVQENWHRNLRTQTHRPARNFHSQIPSPRDIECAFKAAKRLPGSLSTSYASNPAKLSKLLKPLPHLGFSNMLNAQPQSLVPQPHRPLSPTTETTAPSPPLSPSASPSPMARAQGYSRPVWFNSTNSAPQLQLGVNSSRATLRLLSRPSVLGPPLRSIKEKVTAENLPQRGVQFDMDAEIVKWHDDTAAAHELMSEKNKCRIASHRASAQSSASYLARLRNQKDLPSAEGEAEAEATGDDKPESASTPSKSRASSICGSEANTSPAASLVLDDDDPDLDAEITLTLGPALAVPERSSSSRTDSVLSGAPNLKAAGYTPAGSFNLAGFRDLNRREHREPLGVSLAWLLTFSANYVRMYPDFTTHDILVNYIREQFSGDGCAFVHSQSHRSQSHVGPPNYFVCHSHSNKFALLVDSLKEHLAMYDDPNSVFLYIDIFSMSQAPGVERVDLMGDLDRAIDASKDGTLVILDSEGHILNRAWCLLEMWTTLRKKGYAALTCLTKDFLIQDLMTKFRHLDVGESQCKEDTDRKMIMDTFMADKLLSRAGHGGGKPKKNCPELQLLDEILRLSLMLDPFDFSYNLSIMLTASGREPGQMLDPAVFEPAPITEKMNPCQIARAEQINQFWDVEAGVSSSTHAPPSQGGAEVMSELPAPNARLMRKPMSGGGFQGLELEVYMEWLNRPTSDSSYRCCSISGSKCSGKSTVAAALSRSDVAPHVMYFCSSLDQKRASPTKFLRTAAFQLAMSFPNLRTWMAGNLDPHSISEMVHEAEVLEILLQLVAHIDNEDIPEKGVVIMVSSSSCTSFFVFVFGNLDPHSVSEMVHEAEALEILLQLVTHIDEDDGADKGVVIMVSSSSCISLWVFVFGNLDPHSVSEMVHEAEALEILLQLVTHIDEDDGPEKGVVIMIDGLNEAYTSHRHVGCYDNELLSFLLSCNKKLPPFIRFVFTLPTRAEAPDIVGLIKIELSPLELKLEQLVSEMSLRNQLKTLVQVIEVVQMQLQDIVISKDAADAAGRIMNKAHGRMTYSCVAIGMLRAQLSKRSKSSNPNSNKKGRGLFKELDLYMMAMGKERSSVRGLFKELASSMMGMGKERSIVSKSGSQAFSCAPSITKELSSSPSFLCFAQYSEMNLNSERSPLHSGDGQGPDGCEPVSPRASTRKGKLKLTLREVDNLPDSLYSLFHMCFSQAKKRAKKIAHSALTNTKNLIQVMCASRGPVPLALIKRMGLVDALPLLPAWDSMFTVFRWAVFEEHHALAEVGHKLIGTALYEDAVREDSFPQQYTFRNVFAHLALGGCYELVEDLVTKLNFLGHIFAAGFGREVFMDLLLYCPKDGRCPMARCAVRWLLGDHVFLHRHPRATLQLAHDLPTNSSLSQAVAKMMIKPTASAMFKPQEWPLCTMKLLGHRGNVLSVSYSPDNQILASASADAAILWDALTGKKLGTLPGASNFVCFPPCGNLVLTGSNSTVFKLWHVQTRTCLQSPSGHAGLITCASFSPAIEEQCSMKLILATGSDDCKVMLWDCTPIARSNADSSSLAAPAGVTLLYDLDAHKAVVLCVAVSPSQHQVASGSMDKRALLWQLGNGGEAKYDELVHASSVTVVSYSLNGKILATGTAAGDVFLWDPQTLSQLMCIAPAKPHDVAVKACTFIRQSELLVTAHGSVFSQSSTLATWDTNTGAMLSETELHGGAINQIAQTSSGCTLAVASTYNVVRVVDTASLLFGAVDSPAGATLARPTTHRNSSGNSHMQAIYLSPKDDMVICMTKDRRLQVWDVTGTRAECTHMQATVLPSNHHCHLLSVLIVFWSEKGHYQVWDARTGEHMNKKDVEFSRGISHFGKHKDHRGDLEPCVVQPKYGHHKVLVKGATTGKVLGEIFSIFPISVMGFSDSMAVLASDAGKIQFLNITANEKSKTGGGGGMAGQAGELAKLAEAAAAVTLQKATAAASASETAEVYEEESQASLLRDPIQEDKLYTSKPKMKYEVGNSNILSGLPLRLAQRKTAMYNREEHPLGLASGMEFEEGAEEEDTLRFGMPDVHMASKFRMIRHVDSDN
eukprot:gene17430-23732_t